MPATPSTSRNGNNARPPLRFIPHTDDDVRRMLERIGIDAVDALFETIPEKLQLGRALDLPRGQSEQEVLAQLEALAAKNVNAASSDWFLGAGTYAHFLPSAVDALISRSEFYTAYTPYQAEISQGTLQAVFEWQTMLCGLTGLEVTNASMYDGASATAEAALMAMRITRRDRVAVAPGLHPHYRRVLITVLDGLGAKVVDELDDTAACWIVQQPGFLGAVSDLEVHAENAHASGALLIVTVTEALSLALLRAPGDAGADIVCGEAQSFGVPMAFGGPHVGFLSSRQKNVRQMPGRLVGETADTEGKRGFVLTLSTREQHIRRERATSNICTNQGLCLLMATVYLALLGRRGLRELAEINLSKAEYAKALIGEAAGLSVLTKGPTFNEFAVSVPDSGVAALARARANGIVGGLDLAEAAPELGPAVLICTTELASQTQIDRLVESLAGAAS